MAAKTPRKIEYGIPTPVSVCLDCERKLPDFWKRLRKKAYPHLFFLPTMFCYEHAGERMKNAILEEVRRTKAQDVLKNKIG